VPFTPAWIGTFRYACGYIESLIIAAVTLTTTVASSHADTKIRLIVDMVFDGNFVAPGARHAANRQFAMPAYLTPAAMVATLSGG
jgi:hypothetical protein